LEDKASKYQIKSCVIQREERELLEIEFFALHKLVVGWWNPETTLKFKAFFNSAFLLFQLGCLRIVGEPNLIRESQRLIQVWLHISKV
jgi:hypothetical protein